MNKLNQINLLCVGLLLCHTLSFAQSGKLEQIKATSVKLKEVSDSLHIDIMLTLNSVNLVSIEHIYVTPKLVGASGELYELSSFVIASKIKQRYDSRSALLNKKKAPEYLSEYTYSERIPFAEWMESAKLILDGRTYCCGNTLMANNEITIAESVELEQKFPPSRYVMRPFVNYVMPEAEPIKNRAEIGSAKIDFMSGQSTIQPTYKGNKAELEKINTAIRRVMGDSLAKINSILLTAFSSPEGSYSTNVRLSSERASALKKYLEQTINLRDVAVTTNAIAEDWLGFEKLLTNSEIATKQQILKIIAENENLDRREQLIKSIGGGVPWRMMVTEWFPQLRRTDYQLNFAIKEFTVEQGRNIIKTRPGQMSLNEMFHVANSYPEGSNEFNEVFDIAVRMFPDNPIANINAAATAIKQGYAPQALKYLERVKENPLAANNWVAYYILIDDLEKAKEYLTRVPQTIEAVIENEKEIKTKEVDNAIFEKFLKKYGNR